MGLAVTMVNKYLAQEETPFGTEIWEALNAAMLEAAKHYLVGHRLLDVEEPNDGKIVAEVIPELWLLRQHGLYLQDPFLTHSKEEIRIFRTKEQTENRNA